MVVIENFITLFRKRDRQSLLPIFLSILDNPVLCYPLHKSQQQVDQNKNQAIDTTFPVFDLVKSRILLFA